MLCVAEGKGRYRRLAIANGQVPTDDWHPVEVGRVTHSVEYLPRDHLIGDDRVDDRIRDRSHGGDVVDVGEDRRDSCSPGIRLDERWPERFAADDGVRAAYTDGSAIIARPLEEARRPDCVAHHADRALRRNRWISGNRRDEFIEQLTDATFTDHERLPPRLQYVWVCKGLFE